MKRMIFAMSFPKSEVIRRATYYSEDILEHVIEIVVYHDIRRSDVPYWIGELATWFKYVDRLSIKPSNRRLTIRELEDTTFRCIGDDLTDFKDSLEMFQHANKKGKFNYEDKISYPYVKPDHVQAGELMDVCLELVGAILPMLADKQEYSRQDYISVLNSIFKEYI